MKLIGLTGGIGSGKTTVSKYLKEKGYPVIDADKISHEITKQQSVLLQLQNAFGSNIIASNGSLNRKALAELVFSDDNKLKILTDIVTKRTILEVEQQIQEYNRNGSKTVFLDAPLLYETSMNEQCDEVWLVRCSLKERIKRIKKRDGINEDEILNRIQNQMPDNEKMLRSDCVFNNDGPIEDLYHTIDLILRMK